MPKILTRQEAYNIGGSGALSEPKRCCTRSVAESYGCVVSTSYTSNQLISNASAPEPTEPVYRPERIILDICNNNFDYLQNVTYYEINSWDSEQVISPSEISVKIGDKITTTLDKINSGSNNYIDIQEGTGYSATVTVTGPSNLFTFSVPIESIDLGSSIGSEHYSEETDLTFSSPGVPVCHFTQDSLVYLYQECSYKVRNSIVKDPTNEFDKVQKIEIILLGNRYPYFRIYQKSGGQNYLSFLCPDEDVSTATYDTVSGFIRVAKADETDITNICNIGGWNKESCQYRMYQQSDGLDRWNILRPSDQTAWLNWWDQVDNGVIKNGIGIQKDIFYDVVFEDTSYPTSYIQLNTSVGLSVVSQDKSIHHKLSELEVDSVVRGADSIVNIYLKPKEEEVQPNPTKVSLAVALDPYGQSFESNQYIDFAVTGSLTQSKRISSEDDTVVLNWIELENGSTLTLKVSDSKNIEQSGMMLCIASKDLETGSYLYPQNTTNSGETINAFTTTGGAAGGIISGVMSRASYNGFGYDSVVKFTDSSGNTITVNVTKDTTLATDDNVYIGPKRTPVQQVSTNVCIADVSGVRGATPQIVLHGVLNNGMKVDLPISQYHYTSTPLNRRIEFALPSITTNGYKLKSINGYTLTGYPEGYAPMLFIWGNYNPALPTQGNVTDYDNTTYWYMHSLGMGVSDIDNWEQYCSPDTLEFRIQIYTQSHP